MDISTPITLAEMLPALAALVGVGISWGSLSSKIENERGRVDEIVKQIEDRISSSAEKREEIFRRMEDKITAINQRHDTDRATILEEVKKIESKIDVIYDKVANINVCRGSDCVYRLEYDRKMKRNHSEIEK